MHVIDTKLSLGSRHSLETSTVRSATLERIREAVGQAVNPEKFEEELNRVLAARLQDCSPIVTRAAPQVPREELLQTMLNMLSGKAPADDSSALDWLGEIGERKAASVAISVPRAQWKLTQTETTSEAETCLFSASGKVCLADGSTRQFDVGFLFERNEQHVETSSRTLVDPLVLDLSSASTAFSAVSVEFDLNADGKLEQMRLPGEGSGVLFLDRNRNGKADDGSELFGPSTGQGFGELAKLDSDRNGWIDAGDAAFADLRLWSAAGQEQRVQSLASAGVGALSTASAETPFQIKEQGKMLGQMRSSGVWLGESSGAGTVRQIDLATTPIINDET